jgi:hypothetical protein
MARNDGDAIPPAARPDRRRRHAHDPTVTVNLTMPVSLANAVDDAAVARRWTRNAVIRAALEEWLAREQPCAESPAGGASIPDARPEGRRPAKSAPSADT